MKVLVIEDSPEIVESIKLCIGIRWPNSEVVNAAKGNEGLSRLESDAPDAVILDLGLPDIDGLQVLKEIRRFSDVPVLIVSARGDDTNRIRGLELGADDYIVKPFVHTELLARIKAVLRRSHHPELRGDEGLIRHGEITIDPAARRVYRGEKEVQVTASEWALLSFLVRNEGRILPQQVLAEKVWGTDMIEGSTIKMCVRRLRIKLGDDPSAPKFIHSHRGRGYSFTAPR